MIDNDLPEPNMDDYAVDCDWGGCNDQTVGLRWNDSGEGIAGWLPVCTRHRGGITVPVSAVLS